MTFRGSLTAATGALSDEEGRPHRLIGGQFSIANIEVVLRDGCLVGLRQREDRPLPRRPVDQREPLERFLALADPAAPDSAFLRYARRYGLLGLCGHGLPYGHARDSSFGETACVEVVDGVETTGSPLEIERISDWRRHAETAAGILSGLAEPPIPRRNDDRHSRAIDDLNSWLEDGAVFVGVGHGQGGALAIQLGSGTLFGALGVALAATAIAGGPGLALCAGCGSWFQRSPQQSVGKRAWCRKAACQAAKRAAASRDYRRRRREDPMRILSLRGSWSTGVKTPTK